MSIVLCSRKFKILNNRVSSMFTLQIENIFFIIVIYEYYLYHSYSAHMEICYKTVCVCWHDTLAELRVVSGWIVRRTQHSEVLISRLLTAVALQIMQMHKGTWCTRKSQTPCWTCHPTTIYTSIFFMMSILLTLDFCIYFLCVNVLFPYVYFLRYWCLNVLNQRLFRKIKLSK